MAVVSSEPAPDLFGDVPRSVVPDEDHNFLSRRLELLQAPRKELRCYGTLMGLPSTNLIHVWSSWGT
jgi:hypothetical protein